MDEKGDAFAVPKANQTWRPRLYAMVLVQHGQVPPDECADVLRPTEGTLLFRGLTEFRTATRTPFGRACRWRIPDGPNPAVSSIDAFESPRRGNSNLFASGRAFGLALARTPVPQDRLLILEKVGEVP